MNSPLVRITQKGLYCEAGDFFIDPSGPVSKAVITHGHGDHARKGSRKYLTTQTGEAILRARLGDVSLQTLPYQETLRIGDVALSFHPAGHILGSSQIRIEHRGEVWVVSGDYKLAKDKTCAPFEPVPCHTFLTESTFANPRYVFPETKVVIHQIEDWWRENQASEKTSVLFAYALGKAQRILSEIDHSLGPIWIHPDIEKMNKAYEKTGVFLPKTNIFSSTVNLPKRSLVLIPPVRASAKLLRNAGAISKGFTSGWAQTTQEHHRQTMDRGFILSDHADWNELQTAIFSTGATQIYTSHGSADYLADFLTEQGLCASVFGSEKPQE